MTDVQKTLALARLAGWQTWPAHGTIYHKGRVKAVADHSGRDEFKPWHSLDDAAELADAFMSLPSGMIRWSVERDDNGYVASIRSCVRTYDGEHGDWDKWDTARGPSAARALFDALVAATGVEG